MPNKFISNSVLREVLEKATDDEKLSLTKILSQHQKKQYSSIKLQKEICEMGGHGIVNIWRGQGTGYLDIVDEVADELKISGLPSYNLRVKYYEEIESLRFRKEESRQKGIKYAEEAEEKIILKLLELIYCSDKLSAAEKEEFDKQINKVAKKFDSSISQNLAGTAGLVVLGNLGGFATYTFLTTALSTISMGTLGFGAYTAATSLLSIALGPVGWAGLGIAGVLALGKPEYEKLIPIVAIIGAIRQRIKYDNKKEENTNKEENSNKEAHEELITAVKNNNIKAVELLFKKGFDLNKQDEDGYTALMVSSFNNHFDIVKLLVNQKANLNILTTDEDGKLDPERDSKRLADKVSMFGKTALMLATEKENVEIVNLLARKLSTINHKNQLGTTALHIASINGNIESVRILVENNADNKIENSDGFTAFMLAAYEGNLHIVKYLLPYIDNIDTKNKDGFTALIWASFSGKLDVVKFLIENNANHSIATNDGVTSLMYSSLRGNIHIVKFLIKQNINLNAQNNDGYTALIYASLRGHSNIVKFLIEKSADINLKTKDKKTALDFAIEKQNSNIMSLLGKKSNKPKSNQKNYNNINKFGFNNFKAFGKKIQTFSKKPITLIYGPNSVGKSSVIHVVAYLKSLQDNSRIDVQSISKFGDEIDIGGIEQFIHKRNKDNVIELVVSIKDYDRDIDTFFKNSSEQVNLKISYSIDISKLTMIVKYTDNDELLVTKTISYNHKYTQKRISLEPATKYEEDLVNLLDNKVKSNMQYIGPLRPNPQRDYDHTNDTLDTLLNSEKLWALLTDDQEILDEVNSKLKLLEMNYLIENVTWYNLEQDFNFIKNKNENLLKKEERLIFKDLNKKNVEVTNRDLGLGVGQVLPILIATSKYHNTTIAIEQPELHLHPKLQMELADEFIRSYKKNNNEFMIETHSEHLLLRIMKRMRHTADGNIEDGFYPLTPDDVCLLYVDSDGENTTLKELNLANDGILLDSWPDGFFDSDLDEMFL